MRSASTTTLCPIVCALALIAGPIPAAFAMTQCGEASWYDHAGKKKASGGKIDPTTLTAAHRSLPFGTEVHVENLNNGKEVTVEIDDRGPFTKGRIIDVSRAAAERLGFKGNGVTRVRISARDARLEARRQACN